MTSREEQLKKIDETLRLLSDKNLSRKRKHDLHKHLKRLYQELHYYDRCMKERENNVKFYNTIAAYQQEEQPADID